MQYIDENGEEFEIAEFKLELANLDGVPTPSEEEVITEVEHAYQQGQESLGVAPSVSMVGFGRGIWKRIKELLCKVLNEDSSRDKIIDTVIEVVMNVLPGGRIFKKLVKKLVKYILEKGIDAICPA